jgi:RNA polymerase sigma-70 factor (ECF subfamily)
MDEVGHVAELESRNVTQSAEDVTDLEKLLAVLTEEERAIMVMSYACGLSHREIGEATGLPVGTVKSVIFRGKEKIRTSFDIKDHQHG